MVASLLDEGSGELDSKTFPRAPRPPRHRTEFQFVAGQFSRLAAHAQGHRDEAFDLLADALNSPHFDASDVERHSRPGAFSLRRRNIQPGSLANRKFLSLAYGDILMAGRQRHAGERSAIQVADLKDYVRRVLGKGYAEDRPWSAIVDARLRWASCSTRPLGALPAKGDLRRLPRSKPPSRRSVSSSRSTCADRGDVRRPRHPARRPEIHAAYVSTTFLVAAGMSSRLYREVREKRGWPIRFRNICCGWSTPRCSSATPGPGDRAGEPLTPSTRRSAAWPRTVRPAGAGRGQSYLKARRCWRSIPLELAPRCCSTRSIASASITSSGAFHRRRP